MRLDCRRLDQCGFEFTDVKVGDDERTQHEGRGLGLAAVLQHLIHEDFVAAHFACFQLNAVGFEEGEGFFAPRAAGFNVKDGCGECVHWFVRAEG